MPETPNHSYNVPSEGATDWHVPLNENFRAYDTDIEIRDTAANQSNYTPKDGAKFLATDTGVVSVGRGDAWEPVLIYPRYRPGTDDRTGNILLGSRVNEVPADVDGGTIAGGGPVDPDRPSETNNRVLNDFGTISGGGNNQAGTGDDTNDGFATVGGGFQNTAGGNSSTVGGGDRNTASGIVSTIAGGTSGEASGGNSSIGGGFKNTASGQVSTIAGGSTGEASGSNSSIGGGFENTASGSNSSIGGGSENTASGRDSTIAGGNQNEAAGSYSFAAGREAKAEADGAFVWADSTDGAVRSTIENEFKIQSTGGTIIYTSADFSTGVSVGAGEGTWSSVSARSAKRNVSPVDSQSVLNAVEQMEVSRWEYDTDSDATHMGPMADEFHDAFGLGSDADHIDSVDADGVALAAIQGLSARVDTEIDQIDEVKSELEAKDEQIDELGSELETKDDRIAELEADAETKDDRIAELEADAETKDDRIAELEGRLDAVTDRLDAMADTDTPPA